MIDYLDQGQCAAIHHDVHSLRHTQWIFKQSESIMHTNQDPTGLPHFSCEPVQSTHSKAFNETAKAFKTALETACKLIKEIVVLTWKFIKLAGLRFWEIKGRCWWSIAKDFSRQGVKAVKKDAFNG